MRFYRERHKSGAGLMFGRGRVPGKNYVGSWSHLKRGYEYFYNFG